MRQLSLYITICLLLLGISPPVRAQESTRNSAKEVNSLTGSSKEPDAPDTMDSTPAPSPTPQPQAECRFCRWIDLQVATFATRYRYVRSNQPATATIVKTKPFLKKGEFITIRQNQQQQVYELDFKFDQAGRYKIHTRLTSGEWFTRSFSETGWGDNFNGERGWSVFPRQFYLSAEPIKGIELQYGGLDINRGENTENTTYDNDGFITGQRLSLRRPDKIWFDEVSVTYAYIGDFYRPNFFERIHRLGKSNYHQYLVRKKFGDRVGISMDYSSHATIGHLREGMSLRLPEAKIFDSLRVEFYHRLEDYRGVAKGWGYNVQVEKNLRDKLYLIVGVADTDYRYNVLTTEVYDGRQAKYIQPAGTLTADRMIRGLSPFINWRYQIHPYYSIFGFWTTDLKKPTPLPFVYNSDHVSVGIQFNIKKLIQKTKLL